MNSGKVVLRRVGTLLSVLGLLFIITLAYGQDGLVTEPAKAWEGAWKAGLEEEPVKESVSGGTVVIIAYMALWVLLLLYVMRLAVRLKDLRKDVDEIKQRIAEVAGRRE